MCEMRVCIVIKDIMSRYKVRNVKIMSYGETVFEGALGMQCYLQGKH